MYICGAPAAGVHTNHNFMHVNFEFTVGAKIQLQTTTMDTPKPRGKALLGVPQKLPPNTPGKAITITGCLTFVDMQGKMFNSMKNPDGTANRDGFVLQIEGLTAALVATVLEAENQGYLSAEAAMEMVSKKIGQFITAAQTQVRK